MRLPVLFSFVVSTSAHVKLLNTGIPIRNANNPNGDGGFSTRDPCGGSATFGNNGVTPIFEDSTIELKLAYNGGHKSTRDNHLTVAYKCGEVGKFPSVYGSKPPEGQASQFLQHVTAFEAGGGKVLRTVISPSLYPVDASDSLTAGYTVSFKVPPAIGNNPKCTITVADFRNWGGCVDVEIKPKPTSGGPSEIPKKNLVGISLYQAYDISDANYAMKLKNGCDAGNCQCQDADTCLMKDSQDKCWKCGKGTDLQCICNIEALSTGQTQGTWSHSGTCKHDSPQCACIDGTINILHHKSDGSGTAVLNLQGTPYTGAYKGSTFSAKADVPIQQDLQSLVTAESGVTVKFKEATTGKTISQLVRIQTTPGDVDGKTVYVSFSVVDENPAFCGLEMTVEHDKYRAGRYETATQNEEKVDAVAASSATSSGLNAALAMVVLLIAMLA